MQFLILIPLGWLSRPLSPAAALGPMMGLGTAYANVGFFGIPVTQLAFGSDYLFYHVGDDRADDHPALHGRGLADGAGGGGGPLASSGPRSRRRSFRRWRSVSGSGRFEIELPPLVSQPMQFIGSIFTPLALYTLGAQVAAARSRASRSCRRP